MRQEARERDGMVRRQVGMKVQETVPDISQQGYQQQGYQNQNHAACAQDNAARGTDFETGTHRGRHIAEADAMAGLAHHTKRVYGHGGVHNNSEHRQQERDFATN